MTAHWLRGRILFIADVDTLAHRLVPLVEASLEGGVRMVQLRAKNLTDREFYSHALVLRKLTAAAGALLFINDRLDLALAVAADALHLGQEDLPLSTARRLLQGKILGVTCRTPEQAKEAQKQGADYVSLGAIFPSPSKPSAPVVGLDTLKKVRAAVQIPLCAIGGIGKDNLHQVLSVVRQAHGSTSLTIPSLPRDHPEQGRGAGADFVAVISAISQAEQPEKAVEFLVKLCQASLPHY